MKYIRFDRAGTPVWAVVRDDRAYTLAGDPYGGVTYDGADYPLSHCALLAPCVPGKIICIGKNYYDHAVEMGGGVPEKPILFMKGPNAVNHPEGSVHAPDFVTRLDYEGELALVIKKRAKDVPPERAGEYILGYTCFNDVTARDIQAYDGQWTRGKAMDGFAPMGPFLTDEVNPGSLHIETRLNGTVVQSSNTSQLMTDIPNLIAFITSCITLEPGDVVATGTPAGIGPMRPGDTVEVEIAGIGTLRNHVK